MCLMQGWQRLLLQILHCKELWKILPSFILILLGVHLHLPWTPETPTNPRESLTGRAEVAEECSQVSQVSTLPYALTEEYSMMIYTVWEVSEPWNGGGWIQRTMTAGMVECSLLQLCAYKQTSKKTKGLEKISSKYSPRGYKQVHWAQNWALTPWTLLPLAFVITHKWSSVFNSTAAEMHCCTEVHFLTPVLPTPTILRAQKEEMPRVSLLFQECILHWMHGSPVLEKEDLPHLYLLCAGGLALVGLVWLKCL